MTARHHARAGGRALIGLIAASLALAACGPTYPLNMTEAEWSALSADQRLEARKKQADLDAARQAARAEREAAERRREEERRARVAALYTQGGFGDVVECSVEGGVADFHPGWAPYRPFVVAVARGDARPKDITRADGDRTVDLWVGLDPAGHEVALCHRWNGTAPGSDCAVIAGTSRQLAKGVTATVSAEDALKGARVACAYALPSDVKVILGQ